MSDSIRRFSRLQIFEHLATMVLFTALCVTGFPQKYPTAVSSQAIVDFIGGIGPTRLVHRASGVAFAGLSLWHLVTALVAIFRGKAPLAMIATRKDFTDAVTTLKYYLGVSQLQAKFDRFDYRQKFEYWGMVMGNVVMVTTGFALLFPIVVTNFLPGQLIPASKVAHGNEGLMAFLVIIIWHIYNAHLNPDVFPFDTSIFTGKISRHRMEHEHPLELERMEREAKATAPSAVAAPAPTPEEGDPGGK